jgi:hypothetical protein
VQEVALSPRPQDDSVFLKERDRVIAVQADQIRLLTAQVAKLMGGIDKVEDQVDIMQTQVFDRDSAFVAKKVRLSRVQRRRAVSSPLRVVCMYRWRRMSSGPRSTDCSSC